VFLVLGMFFTNRENNKYDISAFFIYYQNKYMTEAIGETIPQRTLILGKPRAICLAMLATAQRDVCL